MGMGQTYAQTECKHRGQPHSVWYMLDDPNAPFPYPNMLTYDTQQEALDLARVIIDKTIARPHESLLLWIKVFRSDNEAYTCFRWERPSYLPPTPSYRQPQDTGSEPDPAEQPARPWWKRLVGK